MLYHILKLQDVWMSSRMTEQLKRVVEIWQNVNVQRNGSGIWNECWVNSYYSVQPSEDEKGFGHVGATSSDEAERRLEVATHLLSWVNLEGQDF